MSVSAYTKFLIVAMLSTVSASTGLIAQDEIEEEVEELPVVQNHFDKLMPGETIELRLRSVPDSVITTLQNSRVFWYANEPWKQPEPKQKSSRKSGLGSFLWPFIILIFIGAVIWFLASSNVGLFRRKDVVIEPADVDENTEDIFAINYGREIEMAVAAGNYRQATRLHFLRLLRSLSDKRIIDYRQDLTNFDYLMQLYKTSYYKEFFRLTRNYEYAWYGQFDPGREGYNIIRREFDEFERKLNYN